MTRELFRSVDWQSNPQYILIKLYYIFLCKFTSLTAGIKFSKTLKSVVSFLTDLGTPIRPINLWLQSFLDPF